MKIHYRCLYLPQNKKLEGGRPEPWWSSYHFTMAVKNGTLGEKSSFVTRKNGKPLTINKSNAHLCRDAFSRWVHKKLSELCGEFILVPVPSKDSLIGSDGPFRAMELVEHVSEIGNLKFLDAVRWTEQLEKASAGGRRDAKFLYSKLKVIEKPKRTEVVLVDDLFTAGAHMKAVRKRLDEAGFKVACGIVCGRSIGVEQMTDDPFTPGTVEMGESLDPFADLFAKLKRTT